MGFCNSETNTPKFLVSLNFSAKQSKFSSSYRLLKKNVVAILIYSPILFFKKTNVCFR